MAKKNKDHEPVANLSAVPNRDIVQRINFLYQASTYLSTISRPPPENAMPQTERKGKARRKNTIRHPKDTAELSRAYVGSMRIVGQKTMVRMDPSIKRTLCKQCDTVLIPGSTATVRVKPLSSHGQAVVYTCLSCKTMRRIPAPPVLDTETQPSDPSAMEVDQPAAATATKSKKRGQKSARPRHPRLPPLFERKGHVIFRGTEVLKED